MMNERRSLRLTTMFLRRVLCPTVLWMRLRNVVRGVRNLRCHRFQDRSLAAKSTGDTNTICLPRLRCSRIPRSARPIKSVLAVW